MTRGEVVYYNEQKGFGFIRCAGADHLGDAFVHISDVRIDTPYRERALRIGQHVQFDLVQSERNPKRFRAINVLLRD